MSLRSLQAIDIIGTDQTFAAVAASDTFVPNQHGFWEVVNASAGSINVTLVVPGAIYGQARPDVVKAVAAGARAKIGPLVADLADPATGLITITHSATASVTGAYIYI